MVDKALEHRSEDTDQLRLIGASRAFNKQHFDKCIAHPELAAAAVASRHFNKWVDKVGKQEAIKNRPG